MSYFKQCVCFNQLFDIKKHILSHNLLKAKQKAKLQLLTNNEGNKYSKLLFYVRQYTNVNWSNGIRKQTPSGNNSHTPVLEGSRVYS